jgi:hypothetical protein
MRCIWRYRANALHSIYCKSHGGVSRNRPQVASNRPIEPKHHRGNLIASAKTETEERNDRSSFSGEEKNNALFHVTSQMRRSRPTPNFVYMNEQTRCLVGGLADFPVFRKSPLRRMRFRFGRHDFQNFSKWYAKRGHSTR